jgi:cytochrome bd ubiquinol oxidase subunit II
VALVTLAVHGALYVAIKTDQQVSTRARRVAVMLWPVQVLLTSGSLAATFFIRPPVMDNYREHPIGLLVPLLVAASLGLILGAARKRKEKLAFVASSVYIAAMLAGAAVATYPVLLPASTDPAFSLTIANSAAGRHGLTVGFTWWMLGMVLAIGYFTFLYRMFRGKVRLEG